MLAMTPEDRAEHLASLQFQVRFHRERRKQVETDRALSAEERDAELAYHEKIIRWLQEQVISLEGH